MVTKLKKLCSYFLFALRMPFPAVRRSRLAFVELNRIRANRRLHQVCRLLSESGYRCAVRMPFSRFVKLDAYGRAACLDPSARRASARDRGRAALVASDDARDPAGAATLRVRYDVFGGDVDPDAALFYPILFHPDLHDRQHERESEGLYRASLARPGERMGVFFAGNCSAPLYDDPETKERFGLQTRWELFERIKAGLGPDELFLPGSYAELVGAIEAGSLRRKVVLVNTNDFEIPGEEWLSILSRADFFIHMPGYVQPFCHNQVESLSVGAVPITEFPRLFRPAFRDGVDCLSFKGPDQLIAVLKGAIGGGRSDEALRAMRERCVRYYAERLSFDSFARRLERLVGDKGLRQTDLYICSSGRA